MWLVVAVTVGAAVIVHGLAVDGVAGVQGVTSGPVRTRADRDVTSGRTRSGRAAFATGARILAHEVDARPIVGALAIGEAFPALAACQSVADVAGRTRAHRPLLAGVVVTRRADRMRTAGIRLAEVTWKWETTFL